MKRFLPLVILASALVNPAAAVTVVWELHDPGDAFFTAQVQATLNKAASDVSAAITTSLAALSQDVYTGTYGVTTATADWKLVYTDPTDGTTAITLNTFSLAANEFKVYVGSRSISGSTLGVGGPAGVGVGFSASGSEAQFAGAVDALEATSNAGMPRGGPTSGQLAGPLTIGATTTNYILNYGSTIGGLSFNTDATWNFDYATLPTFGQNDFYSVAVHEILHSLGFGTGFTWTSHVSGSNWTGSEVVALYGTGVGLVNGGHLTEGLTGHPLIDGIFEMGMLQEAIMDPSLLTGTRKYITDLDLAFLRDMGWSTLTAVPEPEMIGLIAGMLALGCVLKLRWRRA